MSTLLIDCFRRCAIDEKPEKSNKNCDKQFEGLVVKVICGKHNCYNEISEKES